MGFFFSIASVMEIRLLIFVFTVEAGQSAQIMKIPLPWSSGICAIPRCTVAFDSVPLGGAIAQPAMTARKMPINPSRIRLTSPVRFLVHSRTGVVGADG